MTSPVPEPAVKQPKLLEDRLVAIEKRLDKLDKKDPSVDPREVKSQ